MWISDTFVYSLHSHSFSFCLLLLSDPMDNYSHFTCSYSFSASTNRPHLPPCHPEISLHSLLSFPQIFRHQTIIAATTKSGYLGLSPPIKNTSSFPAHHESITPKSPSNFLHLTSASFPTGLKSSNLDTLKVTSLVRLKYSSLLGLNIPTSWGIANAHNAPRRYRNAERNANWSPLVPGGINAQLGLLGG